MGGKPAKAVAMVTVIMTVSIWMTDDHQVTLRKDGETGGPLERTCRLVLGHDQEVLTRQSALPPVP